MLIPHLLNISEDVGDLLSYFTIVSFFGSRQHPVALTRLHLNAFSQFQKSAMVFAGRDSRLLSIIIKTNFYSITGESIFIPWDF